MSCLGTAPFLAGSTNLTLHISKLLVKVLLQVVVRQCGSGAAWDQTLGIFHPFLMQWGHLLQSALSLSFSFQTFLAAWELFLHVSLVGPDSSWLLWIHLKFTNRCTETKIIKFLVATNSHCNLVVKPAFFWEIMFWWKPEIFVPHEELQILMRSLPSRKLLKVKTHLLWICKKKFLYYTNIVMPFHLY